MANLQSVLGALLRDFSRAQHLANRYSATLTQDYKENSLLQNFPVPNAFLEEIEVDLKFAVANGGRQERSSEYDLTPAKSYMDRTAEDIANIVILAVSNYVSKLSATNNEAYVEFMSLEDKFKDTFRVHLIRRLKDKYREHLKSLINTDGRLKTSKAFEDTLQVLREEIFEHKDLKILSDPENSDSRDEAMNITKKLLKGMFDKMDTGFPLLSHITYDELDVIVAADELALLPTHLVQSTKLKLHLREFTLSQTEEEGSVADKLLLTR